MFASATRSARHGLQGVQRSCTNIGAARAARGSSGQEGATRSNFALFAAGATTLATATAVQGQSSPQTCCEAPTTVHKVHQRVAEQAGLPSGQSRTADSIMDGRDFAIFRRPPGIDVHTEAAAASTESLKSLFDMISADAASDSSSSSKSQRLNLILLGEVHDDMVAHHLQLRILKHCAEVCKAAGRKLVLSLEMFESDVQRVLDEYVLQHAIREKDFLQDTRPWGNYAEAYRPLVEFCRENNVQVVAANAPRRYVAVAGRGGSKALQQLVNENAELVSVLPPLPLPPASQAYTHKFIETIASQMPAPQNSSEDAGECPFIGFKGRDVREAKPEMMQAQLLWDHTMAQSIGRALQPPVAEQGSSASPLVVHVCGAFHCAHGLGIPEALPRYFTGEEKPKKVQKQEELPWLPMDDELSRKSSVHGQENADQDHVGAKHNPPGVLSVICWPASVQKALAAVQGGQHLPSLSILGDWVVVTEETFE